MTPAFPDLVGRSAAVGRLAGLKRPVAPAAGGVDHHIRRAAAPTPGPGVGRREHRAAPRGRVGVGVDHWIKVWRDLAAHVADSLAKGDRTVVVGRLKTRSWETPEGEKRSVAEVEAEEVGPSLRWATATPQRATKTRTSGQFNEGVRDAPCARTLTGTRP